MISTSWELFLAGHMCNFQMRIAVVVYKTCSRQYMARILPIGVKHKTINNTRNIGARTKVMGRTNFQESIIVSINKRCHFSSV